MKRILSLVLALMLLLGCVSALADETKQLSVLTVPAGASFPDGVTVGSSDFLLKIEELTGFDLDWTTFTDSSTDGLMLLMASGNTPDLIQYHNVTPLIDLVNNGAITPLDDALAAKGEALLELIPQDVLASGSIGGKVYYLPRYTGGGQIGTMALRKDVLDQLGLAVPSTIEEWEAVLAAVKENTDLTPLMLTSGLTSYWLFASAYGADQTRSTVFYVKDGECCIPLLTEAGFNFLTKMHEWYELGYIDREFLMDGEVFNKFCAGTGFASFVDYTQAARNIPALYEKVPEAELIYVDPPVGANGEGGYTIDGLTSMAWFVPATNADKADLAVEFLNACLNPDVLNLICYGWEGENWQYDENGVPQFIEGAAPADYRGYYSRVVLDRTWDEAWEASVGVADLAAQLQQYRKVNEINLLPTEGVEAYAEHNSEITSYVNTEVVRMIVEGTSMEELEDICNTVLTEMDGQEVIDQINAWLAAK